MIGIVYSPLSLSFFASCCHDSVHDHDLLLDSLDSGFLCFVNLNLFLFSGFCKLHDFYRLSFDDETIQPELLKNLRIM